LNNALYSLPGWNRDIQSGNNGTYTARAGYDCCTGLGVPLLTKLLQALGAQAPQPQPQPQPTPPPATTTHTIVITGSAHVTVDGKPL